MEPIDRKLLKENGKIALKRNFWMIMLVAFVGGFFGAQWTGLLDGGGGVNLNFNYSDNTHADNRQCITRGIKWILEE